MVVHCLLIKNRLENSVIFALALTLFSNTEINAVGWSVISQPGIWPGNWSQPYTCKKPYWPSYKILHLLSTPPEQIKEIKTILTEKSWCNYFWLMAWTYINKAIVKKCWGGFLSRNNVIGTRFSSGLWIEHTPGTHRNSGWKSLTEVGKKTRTSRIIVGIGGNSAVTPKESRHLCTLCVSMMLLLSLLISRLLVLMQP